ncbi:Csu type fimbrial protein [Erwinia aphidicola]|uniref:Csu type fimbrial protein n=1 Tax=Erwinia aphidicola TaxID=68334 RepID=UPI003CF6F90A
MQKSIGGMGGVTCLLVLPISALAVTVRDTFQVSAVIESGCSLQNTTQNDGVNFGTINFGEHSAINQNVDVSSSSGAGSLSVICTPGTTLSIALDYGINGGNSNSRFLINETRSRALAYQLYQDAGYSRIWGTGVEAATIDSYPSSTQTYTVYARLFPISQPPPSGTYTDTVTVTMSY